MSNREDNPSEDEWSTKHRLGMSLAFGLFFTSFLMGFRLTKVGSEGLSGSGSTVESIGVIAAGIFLFGVAFVCMFSFMHQRLPRLTDVKANGE